MLEAANDPAVIELGHVLPGATRVMGLGVNETYRGIVETGGRTVNTYIKFLTVREVFNEALGTVLCKLTGLRTPDAYVVEVRTADYPGSPLLARAATPTAIAFATAAMPLESFVRRVDLRTPDAIKAAIEKWVEWPDVLTFDQWIRNVDRHTGNFLIRGPGEVYLIDHGLAFGGNDWSAATLPGMPDDAMTRLWNQILKLGTDQAARVAALPAVHQFAAKVATIDATSACILTQVAASIPEDDRTALVAFLAARAQNAAGHVCNTIGLPILDLGVGQ
jgi:hypothetical protein